MLLNLVSAAIYHWIYWKLRKKKTPSTLL